MKKKKKINIKIKLHELQTQIYNAFRDDNNSFIVCKLGRRSGKTYLGVYAMLRYGCENPNSINIAVFPTFRLAKEVFDIFLNKIINTPLLLSYSKSDYTITLFNNSRFDFYSATNADSIRGKTYNGMGLIDESAFLSDYSIQEVILPAFATAKQPKFLIVSTPRFKKGFFYEYYMRGVQRKSACISFSGASHESPYVNDTFLSLMKETLTERAYKTEILAEWLSDGDGLFKYQNSKIFEINKYKHLFFGIDVGKTDKSSLVIINEYGETVHIEEWSGEDYNNIIAKMLIVINRYGAKRGFVETNGVGSPVFDILKKSLPLLEGWTSSNTAKNNMIEALILDIEKGAIKILDKYYDLLTNQMDMVTIEYNHQTRNVRYVFARDGSVGHCDSVVALGLATLCRNKYFKGNNNNRAKNIR